MCAIHRGRVKLRSLGRRISIIWALPHGDPEQRRQPQTAFPAYFWGPPARKHFHPHSTVLLGVPPRLECVFVCVYSVAVYNFVHEILIYGYFSISVLVPVDRLENRSQIDEVKNLLCVLVHVFIWISILPEARSPFAWTRFKFFCSRENLQKCSKERRGTVRCLLPQYVLWAWLCVDELFPDLVPS